MRSLRFFIPLVLFAIVCAFLFRGLFIDPHSVPSPLIDKAAPSFKLPDLAHPDQLVASDAMKGRVWLLNVWGSWCVTCREEHATLVELARRRVVPIVGLDWRDERSAALDWLRQFGDPYLVSGVDVTGSVAIDYGVYGAPETFVIDRAGVIRHKVIGALTPEIVESEVLPLVHRLEQ
jgi:cytochrome c biogenesis protein CcmG/thiol:disulfide interchange protein DsbE